MVFANIIRDHFPSMNRYLGLMRAASGPEEYVNAVSEYLAGWPKQKVESLQKVDGGWGPFEKNMQPMRLCTVADVTWMGDAVRRQLVALKDAGVAPNPELVELDLFFYIAKRVAQDRLAARPREDSAAPRQGAYRE